jgi:hypothetical protein
MIRAKHKKSNDAGSVAQKHKHFFVIYMSLLLASYLTAYVTGATDIGGVIHVVGPISLVFGCSWMAYVLVRFDPVNLWTPFPWFLVAVAVYFGLGPLVFIYGHPDTIKAVQNLFPLGGDELIFVSLLNLVGIYVVGIVFLGMSPTASHLRSNRGGLPLAENHNPRYFVLAILLVGLLLKFTLVLPYEFGLSTFVLPGALNNLSSLSKLGLFLLGFMASRYGGVWITFLVIGVIFEVGTDVLRFSKKELLMTMIMPFLGVYFHSRKTKVLVWGGVIVVLAYFIYSPFVHSGRAGVTFLAGNHYQASLSERLTISINAGENYGSSVIKDQRQGWWSRLNYANVSGFAIDQYDRSKPGDSYRYALYTFVPRIIWPSKPNMTSDSIAFTRLFTRNEDAGSATGISIFAEAYWNGGWLYLIIVSVLVGVIFAVITKTASRQLRAGRFIFLPVAFLGIKIGTNVSNWFVPGYIGAFVIFLAYTLILGFLFKKRMRFARKNALKSAATSHIHRTLAPRV